MHERTPQEPYPILYPTARDFRPGEVPYPFSLRAQHALGKLCLALAAGCSAQAEESKKPGPLNPFRPEHIQFRYAAAHFGTGLPVPLSEAEARRIIEEEFARVGLRLESDRDIRDEALAFEIDGVTADRRLGYEWLGHGDMAYSQVEWGGRVLGRPHTLTPPHLPAYLRLFERCLETACRQAGLPHRPGDEEPELQDQMDGLHNRFLGWASAYEAQKASREKREYPVEEPTQQSVGEWLKKPLEEIRKHVETDRKAINPSEVRWIQRRAAQRRYFYALIDPGRYEFYSEYDRREHTRGRMRQGVIERLRKDVRQFLEWARSQGAY